MDFQFPFQLLFRFVITSTLTMIIERKHQVQSNSIRCLRLFGEAATTPRRPGRIRSWPWVSRLPPALPASCAACSRGPLTVALVAACDPVSWRLADRVPSPNRIQVSRGEGRGPHRGPLEG